MASGAGAAAAPAAEAAGAAPAGRGCYLVRTEENSGTLYACWSETVVEGAIAYTSPRKAVPKFKFNQRGGKNELKRGLGGPLIKNYYQGWAEFVKNYVKAFDGSLILYPPLAAAEASSPGALDVGLFLLQADQRVKKIAANELVETVDGVQAVAATNFNASVFPDGITVATPLFLEKGNAQGASIALQ